jgi:hypothetical protein
MVRYCHGLTGLSWEFALGGRELAASAVVFER